MQQRAQDGMALCLLLLLLSLINRNCQRIKCEREKEEMKKIVENTKVQK